MAQEIGCWALTTICLDRRLSVMTASADGIKTVLFFVSLSLDGVDVCVCLSESVLMYRHSCFPRCEGLFLCLGARRAAGGGVGGTFIAKGGDASLPYSRFAKQWPIFPGFSRCRCVYACSGFTWFRFSRCSVCVRMCMRTCLQWGACKCTDVCVIALQREHVSIPS